MYLLKRNLVIKICEQSSSLASQAGSLINKTTLDVSKKSLEALINNIKELTIQEDRKFIENAIRLYNNLPT